MSIDISRVARAVSDLSVGSNIPLKLSHAQQCVAAAFGFKSLAAYQAAKKLEGPVDDNGLFVIIENELLAHRGRELVDAADGVELAAIIREAIRQLYPSASIHSAWNLRRTSVASAVAGLVGLDPISAPDFDDARYQIVENRNGVVQGYVFDFDEPEWAQFSTHIRQRHGSLKVFAPASFLRIVKGCEDPERFYLHGDQHEDRPTDFYCRACDLFANAKHFDSDEHRDHGRRYFDALRMWDRAVARWKLPLRRAINADNILAVRAKEELRAAGAARSDFHRWVEQQVERSGRIGDLARDIMRDESFPTHASTRGEVVGHVQFAATWDAPVAAANDAWDEFEGRNRKSSPATEGNRVPSWPVGPEAINAIAMPPDERAMLVPQFVLLEVPGRVYWKFSDGDDFESSSDGHFPTLERALESAGDDLASVQWIDVTYRGVVRGSCHGWELATHAAKIANDLRTRIAPTAQ